MGQVYAIPAIGTINANTFQTQNGYTTEQRTVITKVYNDGVRTYSGPYNLGTVYDTFACAEGVVYAAYYHDTPEGNLTVKVSGVVISNIDTRYYRSSLSSPERVGLFGNSSLTAYTPKDVTFGFVGGNYQSVLVDLYSSREEAIAALNLIKYPITYSATNGTISGPSEAIVGAPVTVSCTFSDNYYMANPESDIAVSSGGEDVAFAWDAANSQITFTMPESAVTVSVTGSLIPTYPITYRPTHVTLSGPATAAVDATVNVDCTFPEGYGVKTTDTISVTCNRTPVAFSWDSENQRLTFTMPDPS